MNSCLARVLLGLALSFVSLPLWAAESFKKGDDVEAMHMGAWVAGKVESIDRRGFVHVSLAVGGQAKAEPFKPADVRFAWESGALTRARIWTDATGKFRIKAVLINTNADQVTLRKPDNSEVTLPIDKLSTVDRKLVAELAKSAPMKAPPLVTPMPVERPAVVNKKPPLLEGVVAEPELRGPAPQTPPVPEPETFDVGSAIVTKDAVGEPATLQPDGAEPLAFAVGGVSIAKRYKIETFFNLLPVGPIDGKGMWALATLGVKTEPPRLLWFSSADRQVIEQSLPVGETILDYHPASHRLLTIAGDQFAQFGKPRLTVWEVAPTDDVPKLLVSWLAPAKFDSINVPWAKFITSELVIQRTDEKTWIGWNVAKKQAAIRIEQASNKESPAALSPGKRYLAVAGPNAVNIYASETGKLLSTIPSEPKSIGFSRDGAQLVVAEKGRIAVWDLVNITAPPQSFNGSGKASLPRSQLTMVEDYVIINDAGSAVIVYSRRQQRDVWAFTFPVNAHAVVDDQMLYGAELNQYTGFMLGCVKLPPDLLEQATAAANGKPIVQPGQEVKIVCDVGLHNDAVQALLEKKALANGWKLSDDAKTILKAELTQSPAQQVTYEGFEGTKIVRQTVTVEPRALLVSVTVNDKRAWSDSHVSGYLSSSVRLKPGERIQDILARQNKPALEFFENVKIPASISIEGAVGHSTVGEQGISAPVWR